MNLKIFKSWLDSFNEKMNASNGNILFNLDNASVHQIELEYSNMDILIFPSGLIQESASGSRNHRIFQKPL